MSANLWDVSAANFKPDADGVYNVGKTTGELDCSIAGASALTENQTIHMGASLRGADKGVLKPFVGYADAAGNWNWVGFPDWTPSAEWQRFEGSCVVPSGMTPMCFGFNTSGATGDIEVANPVWSYGSPVVLASSAHTPYATQDHVSTVYATKAALKVTDGKITGEVSERTKLSGRVGTLESTSSAHTTKITQLSSSIESMVKGEATYTAPDGTTKTSGIYSKIEQTASGINKTFGSYTKTADLASTSAVKDAKKAGTDAASAASAAQSTADTAKANAATAQTTANTAVTNAANAQSTANTAKGTADNLATLIHEGEDGITVGKSADGKTYSTGRTRMDEDSFDVLDKDGKVVATFSGAAISMLMGLLTITAGHNGGGEIYPADGKDLLLKSGKDAEVSGNHGSYIEVNDVFASLNSTPAGGATNSLMVYNDGIIAQTKGVGSLMLCPVHSMYNHYNGFHIYTGEASEISGLTSNGWTDEGVKFYAFLDPRNR